MRLMDSPALAPGAPEEPIGRGGDRVQGEDMGIIDAYLAWLAGPPVHGTPDTVRLRRSILRRLDRGLPFGLAETCTDDLRQWLYGSGADWKPNTLATYYRAIKSFYGWAADPADPWLTLNPADGLERARGAEGYARPCSDDDLRTILDRAREPFRTWATIAAYNGLRCCEIAGLDRQHVTRDKLIVVRGKGGRPREQATDPYVWAAVRDLPPGPIARKHHSGVRESATNLGHRASRYFRRTLGVDVTMHQFRHWLGCSVLDATDNLRKAQTELGHLSIASTQIYTRVTTEQQHQTHQVIPRLAG